MQDPAASVRTGIFGQAPDGQDIHWYELRNSNGMIACFHNWGATLYELHVPSAIGRTADVVLGFDDMTGYLSDDNQYFGCTAGRYANRIANGRFTIGTDTYQLATNNEPNHLHGGDRGLDKVAWTAAIPSRNSIRFTHTSPDGDQGYPGEVSITLTYTLTDDNALVLEYEATTTAPTHLNLTHHSYFNLSGAGSGTVLDHELQLFASRYTPTDPTLIPTGKTELISSTPLDFRTPTTLRRGTETLASSPALGIDHNFLIEGTPGALRTAAYLHDPSTRRSMTVHTTEPGLQVYTGNYLFGQTGKSGQTYPQRSAVCLETQHYPDSPNHPGFPSTLLLPDETYTHHTEYRFTW
jgi:aldose 1-epimerase